MSLFRAVSDVKPEIPSGGNVVGANVGEEGEYKVGLIKWFSREKAYGFIELADGSFDVFVHVKQLRESGINKAPEPGTKVKFKPVMGQKGCFATDISFL